MRIIAASLLAIFVSSFAFAEEKIDPKLIVGKWTMEKPKGFEKDPGSMEVEFFPDGTLKIDLKFGDSALKIDGKYTLEGDSLKVVTKQNNKEETKTSKITKLTDKNLSLTHPDQKREDKFTRAK